MVTFDNDTMRQIVNIAQSLYMRRGYAMFPYEASDLVQEICLKIMEKHHSSDQLLNKFIWSVGNNIITDLYRSLHGRYTNAKYEEIDERQEAGEEISQTDLRLSFQAMISTRKPKEREILDRYFVGGESTVELAERYGLSQSRISQILHNTYNGGWI